MARVVRPDDNPSEFSKRLAELERVEVEGETYLVGWKLARMYLRRANRFPWWWEGEPKDLLTSLYSLGVGYAYTPGWNEAKGEPFVDTRWARDEDGVEFEETLVSGGVFHCLTRKDQCEKWHAQYYDEPCVAMIRVLFKEEDVWCFGCHEEELDEQHVGVRKMLVSLGVFTELLGEV